MPHLPNEQSNEINQSEICHTYPTNNPMKLTKDIRTLLEFSAMIIFDKLFLANKSNTLIL